VSTSQIPGPPPPQEPPQYPPQQQEPGWGPYGSPPPKRHRLRKWLLILTGVVAAFIGLVVALAVGLGSAANHAANPNSAASTPPAATSQPAASSEPATPVPAGPDSLAMGDAAAISTGDTLSATVVVSHPVVSSQPADPTYGSRPQNGYFVVVTATIAADKAYTGGFDINPLDFYALSGDSHYGEDNGNAYNALTDINSELSPATLAAGETTSGKLAFDVSSPHGYIVYAPNLDGQPLAEWKY
jgi:hypothetical protein